jgi:hypothetical protein
MLLPEGSREAPGLFASLILPQRDSRIDAARPPRREPGGCCDNREQQKQRPGESRRICRADSQKHALTTRAIAKAESVPITSPIPAIVNPCAMTRAATARATFQLRAGVA